MIKSILLFSIILLSQSLVASTDKLFSEQWGLENTGQDILRDVSELNRRKIEGVTGVDIDWVSTFDKEKLKKEIIVAVLDSGLDIEHPDLSGRVWSNPKCDGKLPEEIKDKPCRGWNALDLNNTLLDDMGHGTHVAGIIAANIDSIGIAGVAPKSVKIMPIKIVNQKVEKFVYNKRVVTNIIADGINFAVLNGATVINLSLGWPAFIHTKKVRQALENAISKDVVIVAASGNNNKDLPVYPCAYPGVICVGSISPNGEVSEFSNFGNKVDVVAPGENIISTYPKNLESRSRRIFNFEVKNGSSQAAPFVTGIVATLQSLYPGITTKEIKSRIFNSSTSSPGDKDSKYGLISMRKSIEKRPEIFVDVELKTIDEVEVVDNKYTLSVEVELLVGERATCKLDLKVNDEKIKLLTSSQDTSLSKDIYKRVHRFDFSVLDESVESHQKAKIEVSCDDFKKSFSFNYFLEKKLVSKKNFNISTIPYRNTKHFSLFQKGQKRSGLKKVVDRFNEGAESEWYFPSRSSEGFDFNLIRLIDGEVKILKVELGDTSRILNSMRADFNGDGVVDLLIYAMDKAEKNLRMYYVDNEGRSIFKEHRFLSLPISTFEGLPFSIDEEGFSLMKISTESIESFYTPVFRRKYEMPKEDNSTDFLEAINEGVKERLYYLLPNKKGVFSIRTLESFSFIEAFKKNHGIDDRYSISISNPFLQNKNERSKGEVSSLVLVSRDNSDQSYKITFKGVDEYLVENIYAPSSVISRNKVKRYVGNSNEFFALSLLDRSLGRVVELGKGFSVSSLATGSWQDPIFDIMAGFIIDDSKSYVLESRSYIHVFSNNSSAALSVYRESGFPGVNFSETLKALKRNSDIVVMIDSSLIFGDRVYGMLYRDKKLSRPLSMSLKTPSNCTPIGQQVLGEKIRSNYLCLMRSGLMGLGYIDL